MNLLYIFSLIGFFLVPIQLGRWIWLLPGGFAALNLFLFIAPEGFQPRANVWVYLLLTQVPWIAFALDLIARGRASRVVAQVPLRSWILWPTSRLMGLVLGFAMYVGDLSAEFAFRAAFGDVVTALGATILWAFYRPQSSGYRAVLLFWNGYGFISALTENIALLRAHPGLPIASGGIDIHGYFSRYPVEWIPLFWLPLSLCIHAAIFFKLYRGWADLSPDNSEIS